MASKARRSEQYFAFWRRVLVGDFGPSLSAFPTPVSAADPARPALDHRLLLVATVLTWVIGNLLGGLAGYYRNNRAAQGRRHRGDGRSSHPVLHRRLHPAHHLRLSLAGPADQRRRADGVDRGDTLGLRSRRRRPFDPARAVACAGRHWRLVHRDAVAGLQHRDRGLCHLCRTRRRRAGARSCSPM